MRSRCSFLFFNQFNFSLFSCQTHRRKIIAACRDRFYVTYIYRERLDSGQSDLISNSVKFFTILSAWIFMQ